MNYDLFRVNYMEESIENKRKRLVFRSWHRGTREMDLLLGSFADRHVMRFTESQLTLFDALLKENDPDLYNWYTGREAPPSNVVSDVLDLFIAHQFAGQD